MGALDITQYSTWTTKIHFQQFDSHDMPVMIKAYDMNFGGESASWLRASWKELMNEMAVR